MKYFLTACIVCLITILSCNTSKEKNLVSLLNLPSKQYTINVDKDTTFQTEKGALLKIPAGSLKPENGNTATLEIKEAYSLADMVKAGLFTQADGKPLSSGGMIYIDAAKGQKISFTQPIKVAIPADYLQDGMQLYKGKESDGIINWTNPTVLTENKQLASIDSGEILFQANCASCHAIDVALTGPPLAHFPKRFFPYTLGAEGLPQDWYHGVVDWRGYKKEDFLPKVDSSNYNIDYSSKDTGYTWIKEPQYRDLELYVCNLIHIYGARGTPIDLKWQDLNKIFRYIQNESDSRNLPYSSYDYLKTCTDSCKAYRRAMDNLDDKKKEVERKRNKMISENGDLTVVKRGGSVAGGDDDTASLSFQDFDEKVSPNNFDAVYYQFTFEDFGWYNVDQLIADKKDVEESELIAKVTGEYKDKVNIFLIIPSVKMYAEGGPADAGEDKYAFYLKNGKIPLPQNADAYILVVSESEQAPAFGLKKFTTGKHQEIEISLHAATKDEFAEAMKEFDAARLHIKVDDTKNAAEIRKTDTALKKIDEQIKDAEKLKPRACDCDCDNISPISVAADTLIKNPKVPKSTGDLSITAFPNPSTNVFTVKINSKNQKEKASMRAMDITGKLVEFKNNLAPDQTVTIGSNYKPGTYIVQVIQGQEQKTIKIIKQ